MGSRVKRASARKPTLHGRKAVNQDCQRRAQVQEVSSEKEAGGNEAEAVVAGAGAEIESGGAGGRRTRRSRRVGATNKLCGQFQEEGIHSQGY